MKIGLVHGKLTCKRMINEMPSINRWKVKNKREIAHILIRNIKGKQKNWWSAVKWWIVLQLLVSVNYQTIHFRRFLKDLVLLVFWRSPSAHVLWPWWSSFFWGQQRDQRQVSYSSFISWRIYGMDLVNRVQGLSSVIGRGAVELGGRGY